MLWPEESAEFLPPDRRARLRVSGELPVRRLGARYRTHPHIAARRFQVPLLPTHSELDEWTPVALNEAILAAFRAPDPQWCCVSAVASRWRSRFGGLPGCCLGEGTWPAG